MRLVRSLGYSGCILLLVTACGKPAGTTHADYGRLSSLRIKYKETYIFKKRESALLVYQNHDVRTNEREIEAIYREFFFDHQNRIRRTTAMRDLNLYDHQGRFLYRLRYVWWRGRIIKDQGHKS